jgi:hypothetical protein
MGGFPYHDAGTAWRSGAGGISRVGSRKMGEAVHRTSGSFSGTDGERQYFRSLVRRISALKSRKYKNIQNRLTKMFGGAHAKRKALFALIVVDLVTPWPT